MPQLWPVYPGSSVLGSFTHVGFLSSRPFLVVWNLCLLPARRALPLDFKAVLLLKPDKSHATRSLGNSQGLRRGPVIDLS